MDDEEISARAAQYEKDNRKGIVRAQLDPFSPEENPVSIFMAGSPGAGKTETSKRLPDIDAMLRIDADELRDLFTEVGYNGANSHLFHKAATRLVHEIHNKALRKKISFLLDGTFSNEEIARQNIHRSLKRNRDVIIMFVYQVPEIAWNFVQEREIVEGRKVHAEIFAKKFCDAPEVVNKMKAEFGTKITLRLISKNIDGSNQFYKKSIQRIGDHIPQKFTEQEILSMISESIE